MRGSKREKAPGVWELRVDVGRRPNGDRHQISRTWPKKVRGKRPKGSVAGADAALRKLIAEVENGDHDIRPVDPGTVGDLLAQWINDRRSEWAPMTTSTNETLIATHITGTAFEKLPVARVKAADLTSLYREVAARVEARSVREVDGAMAPTRSGAPTALAVHKLLSSAFGEAVRAEQIQRNPCALVRRPKPVVHREVADTPRIEDVIAVLREAQADPKYRAMAVMIYVALATGARRGELCALRWSDVRGNEIRISKSITQPGADLIVKAPKNYRARTVAIDAGTAAVLAEWKRECASSHLELGQVLAPSWFVWTSEVDGSVPWRPDGVTQRWDVLRKRAGVSMRWHDIRKVTQSLLATNRVGLAEAAERGGHSKEVMLDAYLGADEGQRQEIANMIGAAIDAELAG